MGKDTIGFPEVDGAAMAFGGIPEQLEWEKKAQEAGFRFNDKNPFSAYAMTIFYRGGKAPKKKADIADECYKEGLKYFMCWLGSWSPKHERKEEVTGFILSLIADESWIKKALKKKV